MRARFGTDGRFNGVHGSDGTLSAHREFTILFGSEEEVCEEGLGIYEGETTGGERTEVVHASPDNHEEIELKKYEETASMNTAFKPIVGSSQDFISEGACCAFFR